MLNRDTLRNTTRAKLGIPSDAKVILAVGVFEPRKRIKDIAQAFLLFNTENTYLILLGQAGIFLEYESELLKLTKRSTKIIVHPLVRDVNPFYASADLFVHASEEEVFPLVLQEAASWSIPIICSNYDGVFELLGNGYPYIFSVGDTNSLAALVENVFSNLEFAKSLSWEKHNELHLKLISYRESLKSTIEETSKSQIFLRIEGR
jgi:glycosyltransferase involved in cell wall biosynthesis